jgi:FRG domain
MTIWSQLGVQRRPPNVYTLLEEVANITVATGHRYVWRGVKDARYTLLSSLHRRFRESNLPLSETAVIARERDLLKQARDAGFGYFDGREKSDADLLARLQHAGASTSLLDVTPDPFVALFFATEPIGEIKPCALLAIKVPGKTEAEQAKHTFKGPLPDGVSESEIGEVGIYRRLREELELPADSTKPLLWEAPFVDDRMRAQRGMFLATPPAPPASDAASFDLGLAGKAQEKTRVENICRHSQGNYTRPPIIAFYVSAALRSSATRALDRRFGYRTETIYPDLAGFALANASNRRLSR